MLDFSKNYFELFGLPVSYVVDTGRLAERYRELQRSVHPDRYANSTDQERRLSMQGAVRINEAHQTLKDPVLRARYLLGLHGIDMDAQKSTHDTAFLMEQMMLREELESLSGRDDPYDAISRFMADINDRIRVLADEMAGQFADASSEQLAAAGENLLKMQFLKKLYSDAESLEAELDEAL